MKTVIARIKPEAASDLTRLAKELGWTSSRVIGAAIQLLAESRRGGLVGRGLAPKQQGLQKFMPRVPQKGPNAKYRERFGK